MESLLIGAAMKSRKAWEQANPLLERPDLEPMALLVWNTISDYYERDKAAESVNRELLDGQLSSRFANPKHYELCRRLLDTVPSDVSSDNVVSLLRENRRVKIGLNLAQALSTNNKPEVDKLWNQYGSLSESRSSSSSDIVQGSTLESWLKGTSITSPSIACAPNSLNERLTRFGGAVQRGHVILVFARPEVGKTLFLINMMAGFLSQNLKVLYLANEEPLRLTLLRLLTRLTGITQENILRDVANTVGLARKVGYDNFFASYSGGMTLEYIERAIKQVSPDVVVVDQMRNVKTQADSRVNQLEAVARGLREMAGTHDVLLVASTQAGDSASGKLVLDMGDVDFSNTGIPGAVDLMIGIGMNQEYEQMGQRMINLPKNKPSGVHEFFPVQVDTQMNRVTSI